MKVYDAIRECNGIVAMEYDGYIGKGVYSGLQWALFHKPKSCIWVFRNGVLFPIKGIRLVAKEDWKIRYGAIIAHIPKTYRELQEITYNIF